MKLKFHPASVLRRRLWLPRSEVQKYMYGFVVSSCHGVDKDVAVDMLLFGITQGTVSPISRIIITGTNTSKYK